jgi:SOS-response transcriptional repressor LexA
MDAKAIRLYNLKRLIGEAGGQKKLALKAGVSPAYLSQIVSLRTPRKMGDNVARRLELGMDKPHGWMDVMLEIPPQAARAAAEYQIRRGASASLREVDNPAAIYGAGGLGVPAMVARVPLISWVAAGSWRETIDNFQPGDADVWIDTAKRVGQSAFALRVKGDSMEPTCPDGSVIIVDPEREPENGSLVVVRLDEDAEATFKKLMMEGGRRYLAPLNPRYPVLEISGPATICGVVRQVLIDLD